MGVLGANFSKPFAKPPVLRVWRPFVPGRPESSGRYSRLQYLHVGGTQTGPNPSAPRRQPDPAPRETNCSAPGTNVGLDLPSWLFLTSPKAGAEAGKRAGS